MTPALLLTLPAAYGAFLLARRHDAGPPAAAFAGALYVLSGPFVARMGSLPLALPAALAPYGLALADLAAASPGFAGLPGAAGLLLVLVLVRIAGSGADAYLLACMAALLALTRRPRQASGLGLLVGTLVLAVGALLYVGSPFQAPPLPPPGGPTATVLFPYERPGILVGFPGGHVGIVAWTLAATALIAAPRRPLLPITAVTAAAIYLWGGPLAFLDPLPLAYFGLGMAALAGRGMGLLLEGVEHRASIGQRNALSLVAGVAGLLCFHLTGLFMRGGHRPGEGPGLALGSAMALATLAAAACPILAILRGAWEGRRRMTATAVAAAAILELVIVRLVLGGHGAN